MTSPEPQSVATKHRIHFLPQPVLRLGSRGYCSQSQLSNGGGGFTLCTGNKLSRCQPPQNCVIQMLPCTQTQTDKGTGQSVKVKQVAVPSAHNFQFSLHIIVTLTVEKDPVSKGRHRTVPKNCILMFGQQGQPTLVAKRLNMTVGFQQGNKPSIQTVTNWF